MTSNPEPILSFIDGIDKEPRYLTVDEINELTSPGAGKGDWFAQWLAKTPEVNRSLSLRDLLTKTVPAFSYQSFAVADGTPIKYDHKNPDNPLNSVSRHLRFITVVVPDSNPPFDISTAITMRTLCIVSSSNPNGRGGNTFLQCASWDPNALGKRMGMMRFYQREPAGWTYFGNSFNAFNLPTENFMPFCGQVHRLDSIAALQTYNFYSHVAGALIMKELTVPWTHWYNGGNINEFTESLGSTRTTSSLCDIYNALYDPLFTESTGAPFSLVGRAEDFEQVVEASVSKWYISRWNHDFLDSAKKPLEKITTAVKQWVGHILLNRSMNIAASATSSAQVQARSEINGIPTTMFCNLKALTLDGLLSFVSPPNSFAATNAIYTAGMARLELSLFYDDFSSDPPTRKLVVQGSEGPFAFPIIEPGVEDIQGIGTLLDRSSLATLLPPKAIAALLMVDFYLKQFSNPIYSPRRMTLMEYVPESAQFDSNTKSYNVIEQFTANVRASSNASDTTSPEYEVLKLLDTPDDTYVEVFTKQAAVDEYMLLAEGRRRLFKGFEDSKPDGVGLDEFRLTLPIAVQPAEFPLTHMTEEGDVVIMPPEEVIIVTGPSKTHRPYDLPASHIEIGKSRSAFDVTPYGTVMGLLWDLMGLLWDLDRTLCDRYATLLGHSTMDIECFRCTLSSNAQATTRESKEKLYPDARTHQSRVTSRSQPYKFCATSDTFEALLTQPRVTCGQGDGAYFIDARADVGPGLRGNTTMLLVALLSCLSVYEEAG
ncbi:hypothetical protein BDP27DRAFT_1504065 [Rhodocollybia butyracea]|uniref:Uncharacterized protein n=1 Tax=Rhodocollybia butyracea TaxID=206335 RepID=A0A9P5PAR5_9AGAR|nr:hypothetical protein BDP27DRAFT_1504065 [Rhodocollybia butyracea]